MIRTTFKKDERAGHSVNSKTAASSGALPRGRAAGVAMDEGAPWNEDQAAAEALPV